MARRGFTPGVSPTRSSSAQRSEVSSCVVYYQHTFSSKASFLQLTQQKSCACSMQLADAI